MSTPRMYAAPYRSQCGVNLIEVMVAMVIGLFLVIGATTLYVQSRKTADVDDALGVLQENARYALNVIETDVRMANYWGLKKDGADIDNLHLPANSNGTQADALGASTSANYCGAAYATNTAAYIEATNDSYAFSCTAKSGAVGSADTFTVRRVATATDTAANGRLQVCSTLTAGSVVNGDISTSGCAAGAANAGELHDMVVNGYYVDAGSDQSSTYPSLRRKTLIDGPAFNDTEITAGVEDMQVELSWDNNPGNSASTPANLVDYLQPGDPVFATANPGRIVAVRVWLLIRAEKPDYTFTDSSTYGYANRTGAATATLTAGKQYQPQDHYRRLLVSRTFFIRNVTGT